MQNESPAEELLELALQRAIRNVVFIERMISIEGVRVAKWRTILVPGKVVIDDYTHHADQMKFLIGEQMIVTIDVYLATLCQK